MVLIPSTATFEQKKTSNRVGDSIVKAVEVKGLNPVSFNVDTIINDMEAYTVDEEQDDDITLVAVRVA